MDLVLASFNLHAGVDGWGRPYDVVAACEELGADVLVLQESWAPCGEPSHAAKVASALGYELQEVTLAGGRILEPDRVAAPPAGPKAWGPARYGPERFLHRAPKPFLLDWPAGRRPSGATRRREVADLAARRPGRVGVAVLSRPPAQVVGRAAVPLPLLAGDAAARWAVVVDLAGGLTVAGTHLGHLSHGSVLQMLALQRALAAAPAAVLAGDLNSWYGPLALSLRGWRRAVRGRTWPAGRPHSQIDHVLVRGGVRVLGGEVLGPLGSDHRPVRARLLPAR